MASSGIRGHRTRCLARPFYARVGSVGDNRDIRLRSFACLYSQGGFAQPIWSFRRRRRNTDERAIFPRYSSAHRLLCFYVAFVDSSLEIIPSFALGFFIPFKARSDEKLTFESRTANCYDLPMVRQLLEQLFSLDIFWKLPVFFAIIFTLAVGYLYFKHKNNEEYLKKISKKGIYTVFGFKIIYAIFLTLAQYFVWDNNGVTKALLKLPVKEKALMSFGFLSKFFERDGGYYYFYVFARYWLVILISFAVAYLFYLLLKGLKKYKERFFIGGEPEIGFALAFIVGWPDFVLFLPGIFILIIPVSIFRMVVFKEKLTTLGWPFIVSAILAVVLGYSLLDIFRLASISI